MAVGVDDLLAALEGAAEGLAGALAAAALAATLTAPVVGVVARTSLRLAALTTSAPVPGIGGLLHCRSGRLRAISARRLGCALLMRNRA